MKQSFLIGAAMISLTMPAAAATKAKPSGAKPAAATVQASSPLLDPWKGPYGGLPPFGKFSEADFKPAVEAGIAANLRDVNAVANNPAKPTFENTIVAMEKSGMALNRALSMFFLHSSNLSTPAFQKIEADLSPKIAASQDVAIQNAKLFARIDAVYNDPAKAKLTPEQQRLIWVYWNNYTQSGAKLNPEDKKTLSGYNQKLAGLYTKFSQNELADEENYALVLDDMAQLAGLSDAQIAAAAADAAAHGKPGKWRFANTRSAMEPFITNATDRSAREKGWRMWISRGDNGNANDNNATIVEILQLRAKKANLLGYPTYAHWHLADTMAKTPDNALNLSMKA